MNFQTLEKRKRNCIILFDNKKTLHFVKKILKEKLTIDLIKAKVW